METVTMTVGEEITTMIHICQDEIQNAQDEINDHLQRRKEAKGKVDATDAAMEALQREIEQIDHDLTTLAIQVARGDATMDEVMKRALETDLAKRGKEIEKEILRRGRSILVRKHELFNVLNPKTGQFPLAEANARDAKFRQQLIFWDLMNKYLETGSGQDDHDLKNQAHRCRFTTEELEEADRLYRAVRKERGEFFNFSSRQIGGYEKPAPWPGC